MKGEGGGISAGLVGWVVEGGVKLDMPVRWINYNQYSINQRYSSHLTIHYFFISKTHGRPVYFTVSWHYL